MNRQMVLGVVRHLLTLGGGALVANGWADDGMVTEAAGAIVTLVGVGWSIWEKIEGRRNKGEGEKGEAK